MQVNAQGHVEFHLKKNALHNDLNVPAGHKIPVKLLDKKLAAAKKSGNTIEEKRIIFAKNARKFHHGS